MVSSSFFVLMRFIRAMTTAAICRGSEIVWGCGRGTTGVSTAGVLIGTSTVRRPNRPFAGDQLLGSECGCCLFDVRWPCIINDERLIWDLELRPIIFSVNPFYTDTYF